MYYLRRSIEQNQGFNSFIVNVSETKLSKSTEQLDTNRSLLDLIPYTFAKTNRAFVLHQSEKGYEIAIDDKPQIDLIVELKRHLKHPIHFSIFDPEEFDLMLRRAYGNNNSQASQVADDIGETLDLTKLSDEIPEALDLLEDSADAPIIRLINALISQAVHDSASDIHLEAYEKKSLVRFRIDGILRDVLDSKRELHSALVSRLKVMANLDIAEKRLPQDGRISIRIADHSVDIRLSTLPSQHGERVVLRLLDKTAARFNLSALGMNDAILDSFKSILKKSHGIFLVTGPTGSGKTTSLYSGLAELDRHKLNVLTVEDPVEYDLDGISQTQVNNKAGLTFARGLRSILRQDPDVILIGEMRDLETAQIAVQSSLTGHLVLSTLHTNSAIGGVTRLIDMGIEPFLISSTVIGVLSQRLVRQLCSCSESYLASDQEKKVLGIDTDEELTLQRAKGCSHCNQLGYKGRFGIYELIEFDDQLKIMIHDGASEEELQRQARKSSNSLADDGIRLVLSGQTTIEEIIRVTSLS